MDERKDRHLSRYLRGAKKFEQRLDHLAEKKRRGGPRPRRPGAGRDDEDEGDDDLDLEAVDSGADDLDPDDGREVSDEHEVPAAFDERAAQRDVGPSAPSSTRLTTTPAVPDRALIARVTEVARTELRLLLPDGAERTARVVPRVLALGGLVVGDEVQLDGPNGGAAEDARVVQRLARRTLLTRRDPGGGRGAKLLAANVDIGLAALAPRADGLSLGFLERALAAFEAGGIAPCVVVTKADLLDVSTRSELEEALTPWAEAGVPVHFVGAPTGAGLEPLRDALAGRVTVLLGHSGVGKSTLVNALDPAAARPVGAVRTDDGRGRHTTTASRLVPFRARAGGPLGALVDTPGVRQLVPDGADVARLAEQFPALAAHLGRCRFRDCAHAGEPGCAVTAAAAEDEEVGAALVRLRRLVASLARDP